MALVNQVQRPAFRWLLRACLLLILLPGFQMAEAQTAENSALEWQVKAAYLYKFGNYIEWPPSAFASADSALKIGILGADALADELLKISAGRTINGRLVSVHKLRREDSLAGMNVLFIGRSNRSRLADILASVKGQPVLTVTESDDALAAGSMINLVVVDAKLRFEVAPRPAAPGNLVISARLLAVAYKVALGPT